MGLVNIECRRCGEPMWIEPLLDAVFDFPPASVEVKRLFQLSGAGIRHVWMCYGCDAFEGIRGSVSPV